MQVSPLPVCTTLWNKLLAQKVIIDPTIEHMEEHVSKWREEKCENLHAVSF